MRVYSKQKDTIQINTELWLHFGNNVPLSVYSYINTDEWPNFAGAHVSKQEFESLVGMDVDTGVLIYRDEPVIFFFMNFVTKSIPSIHYVMNRKYWGKKNIPLFTAGLDAMIKHMKLSGILGITPDKNLLAKTWALRVGFKEIGILPGAFDDCNGFMSFYGG